MPPGKVVVKKDAAFWTEVVKGLHRHNSSLALSYHCELDAEQYLDPIVYPDHPPYHLRMVVHMESARDANV